MSWEIIENSKPVYASKQSIPPMGLTMSARRAGRAGKLTTYIALTIGEELAKKAAFAGEQHRCHILLGGGRRCRPRQNPDRQCGRAFRGSPSKARDILGRHQRKQRTRSVLTHFRTLRGLDCRDYSPRKRPAGVLHLQAAPIAVLG